MRVGDLKGAGGQQAYLAEQTDAANGRRRCGVPALRCTHAALCALQLLLLMLQARHCRAHDSLCRAETPHLPSCRPCEADEAGGQHQRGHHDCLLPGA